jgi:hypothetical protein
MTTHGGYENLVCRGGSESAADMQFKIVASLSKHDLRQTWHGQPNPAAPHELTLQHKVTVMPGADPIDTPFSVSAESVIYEARMTSRSRFKRVLDISRSGNEAKVWASEYARRNFSSSQVLPEEAALELVRSTISSSTSMLVPFTMEALVLPSIPLRSSLGSISLYELAPARLREDSVPSPTPRLTHEGGNMPAVLAWLKQHDPMGFHTAIDTLLSVLPTLDDVDVVETERGRLRLELRETGLERPWMADDVSDGTLRLLGLLVAALHPTPNVSVIEEPENGLHPWAIDQFIDACRQASQSKQIILTTHSPILIDRVRPEEIWVVSKSGPETKVDPLVALDPDAQVGWQEGEFTLSHYLRSGIVREAVPVHQL